MHEAVQEGHKVVVEQFIYNVFSHRQEILTVKNKDDQTPLHLAASKGFSFC
jgi:ankyrin repeat protein